MNKERLIRLAELLEANAGRSRGMRLDLATWIRPADIEVIYPARRWEPGPDCGTVGCAIGLACVSGAFAKEGLRLSSTSGGWVPVL